MRKRLMNKKGQMNSGPGMILSWIIAFGIIGLLAAVFLLINTEFKEETYTVLSDSVVNESGGFINATGYTLDAENNFFLADNFVITVAYDVFNLTAGVFEILSGNWTLGSSTGLVTNATVTVWSDVNFTYTFDYRENTTATKGIEDASKGIAKITSKLPLIGTIIVLSVIQISVLAVVAYVRLQAGAYGQVQ